MAGKIISPGVFTQENDLSFLPTGIAAIGGAFIGPTTKGPAFRPTRVTSYQDFIDKFGDLSSTCYLPYALKSYLASAGSATIVRVMGKEPWIQTGVLNIIETIAGVGQKTLATLVPIAESGGVTVSFSGSNASASAFTLTSSYGSVAVSFDPTSTNYISNLFSTSPTANGTGLTAAYYLYRFLPLAASASAAAGRTVASSSFTMNFITGSSYAHGVTPYITSQIASGQTFNLFKIARISDGVEGNYDTKVTIEDIKKPGTIPGTDYGSFSIYVRRVGGFLGSQDTDQHQEVLEAYTNVNIDPSSPNYILKVIGDMDSSIDTTGRITTSGDFTNKSKYIFIVPVADFDSLPSNLYPSGFRTPILTTPVGAANNTGSSYSYVTRQGSATSYDRRVDFGFDFYNDDQLQLLWSICDANIGITASFGGDFNLDYMFSHVSASTVYGTGGALFAPNTSLSSSVTPGEMLKFAVPFQGGHEGMPYNRRKNVGQYISSSNVFGFDCSLANSSGSIQFNQAINVFTNADEYDINLLVVPGIISSLHPSVTSNAIQVCENRGDAFFIMDTVQLTDNITQAIANVAGFNTNYAGTYYPWVKVQDSVSKKLVWVPPSVMVPGVFANNDKLAYEWYAPAGLNRGGIPEATSVYARLNQDDRDNLYLNRINPIASFPAVGIAVWGQKTLQTKASALDRINVRRLLIATKKYIASATKYLVFEQNTKSTHNRFLNIVNPYLEGVKQKSGIYAFKAVMDETNNTNDLIDRNIMYGQLYLQPTRTAEFILIDFNIQSTGAQFSNA